MTLAIPQPIKTFPGGSILPVLPSRSYMEPKEGKRYIPVDITWPAGTTTYDMNVQGLTTQPFSQVVMIDVDNYGAGVDVTFIFPDTSDTLNVPAASGGLFPVFTNSTQFYVSVSGALATDKTRFRILNYLQEPVSLPPPQFNQIAAATNVTSVGTFPILGPSVSGTLTGWSASISGFANGAGASGIVASLINKATGAVLDRGSITMGQNQGISGLVFNVSGAAVRFTGGLDAVVTASGSVTSINVDMFCRYRQP